MAEREISLSRRVRTELHSSVAAVNGWDFSQRLARDFALEESEDGASRLCCGGEWLGFFSAIGERERERDLRDFFCCGLQIQIEDESKSIWFIFLCHRRRFLCPLWVLPPLLYLPTDGCCEIFRI
jgi:hypothetical protein